ncbi:MAG: FixH family protein [Planctomycetota bacterium]
MREERDDAARPRSLRWPLIIVGMLLTHVSAMMLAVKIASGDTGHAVLPDYYQRAVAWDDLQAEARASARLGWTASVTPSVLTDERGRREIRVVLHDRFGAAVEGAALTARTWHLAVGDPIDVAFQASAEPGVYVGRAAMERPGRWHVDLVADQGPSRFVETSELDLVSPFSTDAPGH